MAYSTNALKEINKVSADNLPVTLLEITHPSLTTPLRVVNDRQDIAFESNVYNPIGFNIKMPSDLKSGLPRASLSIDNVSKDLISFLESTNGGAGTIVRIIQVLRTDTSFAEYDISMNLSNININSTIVSGELGFDDLLNIPAVSIIYSPEFASGLF